MSNWIRMAALWTLLAVALPAGAAKIVIVNEDGPDEGLNDSSAREPVGGNEGATLGEQRGIALEFAAELLGSRMQSDVSINVAVNFEDLDCSISQANLASAGATRLVDNFADAPRDNTFYPVALANAIASRRLVDGPEIEAVFTSALDDSATDSPTNAACLGGADWYYGLDGNPESGDLNFVSTAVHEIVHGLGFQTFTNPENGEFEQGTPDIYAVFIRDLTQNKTWPELSANERAASAENDGNLVWNGPAVTGAAPDLLSDGTTLDNEGTERVLLYAPSSVQPGSSISHWDTSLQPDALMEPFDTPDNDVLSGIGLAACQLQDIGWTLINDVACPDTTSDAIAGPADSSGAGADDGGGGGGGGCTLSGGRGDPVWPAMLLLASSGLVLRRRRGA